MKQKTTAFTLIELLVVIVIIGILATISTATFSEYNAKARDTKRLAVAKDFEQKMLGIATTNQTNDFSALANDYLPYYLQEDGFDFSNIETDRCIWLGINSLDPSKYIVTFSEEVTENSTFKALGNNDASVLSTAGAPGMGCGAIPTATGFSFRGINADKEVCSGSNDGGCCFDYIYPALIAPINCWNS